MEQLFIAEAIQITPNIAIEILFDKEMNYRELVECYIRIVISLKQNKKYKETKKLRYVYEDRIISFDSLMIFTTTFLKNVIHTIEAIDSGINLTSSLYLNSININDFDTETRKLLKKSIEEITEYKLQPYIIKLYTVLTSFKGSDTVQKRKYKKMIEHQEESIRYNTGGSIL